MATTAHWPPNSSAISRTRAGRSTAAVFTPTLSAPARRRRRASSAVRTPATHRQGDEDLLGRAGHHRDHGVAPVGRSGDVEEGDFVGALGVVPGRQLDRVALVGEVDEADALDHTPTRHVEAGDQPDAAHAATPSATSKRPSTSALPTMTPCIRRPPPFNPPDPPDPSSPSNVAEPARPVQPAQPVQRRPARPDAARSARDDTPPDATSGSAVAASSSPRPARSGPGEHAVARHRRGHHRAERLVLPARQQVAHGLARAGQPAVRLRLGHAPLADAVVEPDRDASGPAPGAPHREVRVLQGGRAEHDPLHARLQHLGDRLLRADAAAGLHPDALGRRRQADDVAQYGALVRHAGARRVEVDDVDPAGAAGDVARRQRVRVAVALLAVEVALGQAHGRAGAQVDGREQLH